MVLDDGWELPILESISVTEEELLLLDWVICSGSSLIPSVTLEDLITNWSSFRYDIWKGISAVNRNKQNNPAQSGSATELLPFDEFLARTLLALVPTTFRWGTGADCGYELKLKLYRFLNKEGEITNDDSKNNSEGNSTDESTGTAGTGT